MRVLSHLLTLSAVVAGAARAEATGPTAVYPLSARLTVTSETRDRCLVRRDEACEVLLQDILQKTYESVLRRMFRAAPPDAPADLDITVSPAFADIIEGMGARQVVLETSVVIAAATTGEIDRLGHEQLDRPLFAHFRDDVAAGTQAQPQLGHQPLPLLAGPVDDRDIQHELFCH